MINTHTQIQAQILSDAFSSAKPNQAHLPLFSLSAERKEEHSPGPRPASKRHAAAMATAPELQRAEKAETGLGHPTHQCARELARTLPAAAGEGEWRASCRGGCSQLYLGFSSQDVKN